MHQQLKLNKMSTKRYTTSDKQYIYNFKHEGYHKEVNSGIEITEARGDEDVSRCSLPRRKVVTVGEVRDTTKTPERHEGSPSSPSPPHEARAFSLRLAFPPLRRWQAPQPLHNPHEGEDPGLFTIFHEEVTAVTTTKPSRRSPSKSNKHSGSHSN